MRYTIRCFMLIVSLLVLFAAVITVDSNVLVFVGVPIWLGWVLGELLAIDQKPYWQYRLIEDEREVNEYVQETMPDD